MYQLGKTTMKMVPACSFENCSGEAGYAKCELCGSAFCETHRSNIGFLRIGFEVSYGFEGIYDSGKRLPVPYGVHLCLECQKSTAAAPLIDSYRRAQEALKLAGEIREKLISANARLKA